MEKLSKLLNKKLAVMMRKMKVKIKYEILFAKAFFMKILWRNKMQVILSGKNRCGQRIYLETSLALGTKLINLNG